ncbi:MAG TPA: PspC domain-containing protein [Candidatus Limnocylindrales bacterium]|jgi:phage shock protein C
MTSETTEQAPPQPEVRRLYRSRTNRQLAGVCAGVAEYLGGDPTFVRLATVVVGLFTGIFPMVVLYIVAAIVVPERPGGMPPEPVSATAGRSGQGALFIGVLLIVIGGLGLANVLWRIDWDLLWPFGLIAFGVLTVTAALGRR